MWNAALDSVRNLYGAKSRDFITAVDEKNVIVVKELALNEGYDEMFQEAEAMKDVVAQDGEDIHVALGTIVGEIKGSIQILQGSQDGFGCGTYFL